VSKADAEVLREEGRKEERAKLNITLRGRATVSGEYPNLIVTGLYFGELSEQAREEGRREILKEIAALPCDRSGQYEGLCWFCGHTLLLADGMFRDWESDNHEPTCLWLKAKSVQP
jgi:hypothetical protein